VVVDFDPQTSQPAPEPKIAAEPVAKERTVLNTQQNYKKGATYMHSKLGKGTIESSYQFQPNDNLLSGLMKTYDNETNDLIKQGNVSFYKINVRFPSGVKSFILPSIKQTA
jgi:hypothetical protein